MEQEARVNLIVEQLAGRIAELTVQLAAANAEMALLHDQLEDLKAECGRGEEDEETDG